MKNQKITGKVLNMVEESFNESKVKKQILYIQSIQTVNLI